MTVQPRPRRGAAPRAGRARGGRAPRRRHASGQGHAPGRRLVGLFVATGLVFSAVAARLAYVQVLHTQRYVAYGRAEMLRTVSLPASRGTIYDDQGNPLALSVPETTIAADPYQVVDPNKYAAALAPLLGVSRSTLVGELSEKAGFVYIAHQVGASVTAKVKALGLAGLTYIQDPKRFQPDGTLVSNLIGFVGTDETGLSGLEYQYNSLLTGHPGRAVVEQDPAGYDIAGGLQSLQPARPGSGMVLTINTAIQYDAEQDLARQITATDARAGIALVMQPSTGDILAMVDLVNPGYPGVATPKPSPSPLALTEVYEPGSVAKVTTFAAALQAGLITPSTTFTVPDHMTIDGAIFHDAEVHPTETLSAHQILDQSSNIGTILIAEKLGKYAITRELRAFGWGEPTGLDFPGESRGLLVPPARWSGTAIGSVPIGQDEAVTALQVLDTYDTVANGGVSVPPRLLAATVGTSGQRRPVPAGASHRVVTSRVASELTSMLEGVATPQGTAPAAAIPGYVVAGKTGTAQEPRTNAPGYVPGAFMATFAGFVPAQAPAVSAVVVLDRPNVVYGGAAAAPVFAELAQQALRQLDVPPGGAAG